jgi:hypothetical protein
MSGIESGISLGTTLGGMAGGSGDPNSGVTSMKNFMNKTGSSLSEAQGIANAAATLGNIFG